EAPRPPSALTFQFFSVSAFQLFRRFPVHRPPPTVDCPPRAEGAFSSQVSSLLLPPPSGHPASVALRFAPDRTCGATLSSPSRPSSDPGGAPSSVGLNISVFQRFSLSAFQEVPPSPVHSRLSTVVTVRISSVYSVCSVGQSLQ